MSKGKKNVFIVHGRDEDTKSAVIKLLKGKGLIPKILHELPNSGKAIIEKLESHSNSIDYAIILLTPDDVGGIDKYKPTLKRRARQNVIFELGFFVAKLGRSKVCAINKGVEIPSDYEGVVYVPMKEKDDGWKKELLRELETADIIKASKSKIKINSKSKKSIRMNCPYCGPVDSTLKLSHEEYVMHTGNYTLKCPKCGEFHRYAEKSLTFL